MKILIVDPDVVRAPELKLAFAAQGVDVTVAPNGSFALTMLEWNRHDAVVSRARIDDMDGHELCAILKSDPGTRDVRFVLVAGNDDVTTAQTTAAGVELVLPPALSAAGMVGLVLRLVNGDGAPPAAPTPPPAAGIQAALPPVVPAATAPAPAPRPPAPVGVTSTPFARRSAPPLAPAPPPASVNRVASPPSAPEPRPVIPASGVAPAPPSAPVPTVPKLRPDPVTTPAADPPKRYVTAAAAAAAAPWTKLPGVATPPTPPVTPAMNLEAMPSGTFQGSLEVMDLAELTQAIAMGRKNGRLILALPHGGGVVAFEGGQVVHAEYRGTVGETAFAALLTAAHADTAGRFCFLPAAAGEKVSPSRTIDKTVDRLLLSIATAIDEKG